jgi:ferritin
MLIGKKLNDAINAQIGHEFQASNQYLAMAVFFEGLALKKLAKAFYKQSDEERQHGLKLLKYVVEAGGSVVLPNIPAPKYQFADVVDAFKLALEWELQVTKNFNDLMDIAVAEKDYLAQQFLNWFVNEQLEEVSTMDNYLKVAQAAGPHMIMLEAYLSHE